MPSNGSRRSTLGGIGVSLQRKFDAMAQDAASFLRATAPLFYYRLKSVRLPPSPLIFGCGDLHLENFGSYAGDNRLIYFDQNDFDEAALMPAAVELVRLLTSILITVRLHEPDDVEASRAARSALSAYCAALVVGKSLWIERELARGAVADLLDGLAGRTRRDQLDLFTRIGRQGRRKLLRDWRRTFPLTDAEKIFGKQVKATLAFIGKERGEAGFWKLLISPAASPARAASASRATWRWSRATATRTVIFSSTSNRLGPRPRSAPSTRLSPNSRAKRSA